MIGSARGFALIAVLWVVTAAGAVSVGASAVAREALAAIRYRTAHQRAGWAAEGCLAEIRSAARGWLVDGPARRTPGAWARFDRFVIGVARGTACTVTAEPVGVRISVNDASGEQIRRLLVAVGESAIRADSLAQTLEDWRDRDDIARGAGAEAGWYRSAGRFAPRNGPFEHADELRYVLGWEDGRHIRWFDTRGARVPLSHAPAAVLRSLPGVTPELARLIVSDRSVAGRAVGLDLMGGRLSRTAADSLAASYAVVAPMVSPEPGAWLVTVSARDRFEPVDAVVEVRLARGGDHLAVVEKQVW